MIAHPACRTTQEKRPALWKFEKLDTIRKRIIQRAGRLIRPQGKLTLSTLGYSMKKIGEYFELHYSTISRIVGRTAKNARNKT